MMSSLNDDSDDDASCSSSSHDDVKSTAVVKYSTVDSPPAFALLKCDTDLNRPPANWLSSSAEPYGLQYVLSNSTGFSSFRMADMFPDCVGEVDVISDAENIKKLLKMSHSYQPVSMLVHRIKTTLLIDDFDIQKLLCRPASMNWKQFVLKCGFQSPQDKRKWLTDESKRRNALQQENLISKFLYHSIGQLDKKEPEKLKDNRRESAASDDENLGRPPLPEPNIQEEIPGAGTKHPFVRNVVWTFENIQMLLGTDMPIFGGGTHPCVSLRLRDMNKPISVLTGIDYWLDNLMCNVPEVAMCYHIGGIVQKYELINTRDIPFMEGSKFSPSVVRDVAQDILAFLKSNATKAGHTYWLLKGKDDDVVKLYDLTSLCAGNMVDNAQNPFTIPVALLLYRVARNMKHSPRVQSPTNPTTIRMLLKNCIKLLPVEKYPQIVTSAHYMFSDSLIPLSTDPSAPKLEDVFENIFDDEKDIRVQLPNQDSNDESQTHCKTLCLSNRQSQRQPYKDETSSDLLWNNEEVEILRSLEKRCKTALEHIANGLSCLKYFDEVDPNCPNERRSKKEEEQCMAHPSEPIPMPYESIRKDVDTSESEEKEKRKSSKKKKKQNIASDKVKGAPKNAKGKKETFQSIGALLCKSHVETMPTWQQPPDANDNRAWKQHLKTLLYEKACLVYATLAEHEYSLKRFGSALKHIRLVLESRAHLDNGACENILMSYLLGRAGDCCFQMCHSWDLVDQYRDDFSAVENFDAKMMAILNEEETKHYKELDFIPSDITSLDNILNRSWMCYSKAFELESREEQRNNLQRRLGNICNELGSFYMKQAREAQSNPETSKATLEALFAISQTHLENGIKAFKVVDDDVNLALLYSNKGRLMRLMALYHTENNCSLNKVAKEYYNKALNNYQMALTALNYRHLNPEIWDVVHFEMSSAQYMFASQLQDYPPQIELVGRSELEREVVDCLCKALRFCDMETPGPNQPIYQYRAADIHHRLAKLYHSTYRNLPKDSQRRSRVLLFCNNHFEKAIKLFEALEEPTNALRARLERIALYETISNESINVAAKIKNLQNAIELILQSASILKVICDRNSCGAVIQNDVVDGYEHTSAVVNVEQAEDREDEDREVNEEGELLQLMESRFQFILRSLIKLCSASTKYSNMVTKYKEMYSVLLRSGTEKETPIAERLHHIVSQYENAFADNGDK